MRTGTSAAIPTVARLNSIVYHLSCTHLIHSMLNYMSYNRSFELESVAVHPAPTLSVSTILPQRTAQWHRFINAQLVITAAMKIVVRNVNTYQLNSRAILSFD